MNDGAAQRGGKKRAGKRYWREIKGRLYARLQYVDHLGKPKEKLTPITDKRKARSEVERLRSSLIDHGPKVFSAQKMTFSELVDEYETVELVEAVYQGGVKVRGRRSVAAVRTSIKPLRAYFGEKKLGSLKSRDVVRYKELRMATPIERVVKKRVKVLDPRTGRTKSKIVSDVHTRQRKVASVIENPFMRLKGIVSASAEVVRNRVLSFEEEARLLEACDGDREHVRPILICALDTGMRRGELFKMKWRDVNFASGEIYIPQTNTKTEEARKVGITPRLRRELERKWSSSIKEQDEIVFGIKDNIKNAWRTACQRAGIEDFRFHDCRHTATTRMIASGSPHTEVMKITGHSQMKTFLRYLTITPETANKVASRLERYNSDQRT